VIATDVPLEPLPGVKLVMLGGKKKLLTVVTVPLLVVKLINPVVADGAVATTEPKAGVANEALTPLNFTDESPSLRLAPVMVTLVPAGPALGEKPESVGWILKLLEEKAVPAGAVTLTRPLFMPVGTVAEMLLLLSTA
jgi:hypothetical protein